VNKSDTQIIEILKCG